MRIKSSVGLSEEEIKDISQIYIVACGSAYHVGIAAQYVIEDLAKIPVRVELGSEFRYRNPLLDPKGLVIVISQSGETADSLAALRESKEKGVRTMAIVNVVGSSIAREADSVFYTLAGPDRRSNNKSLQYTAYGNLYTCPSVCKSAWRNLRRNIQKYDC